MMVFYKANLVFLAVPKTGSSAYAMALKPHADLFIEGPPELKHAPVYRYNRFFFPLYQKVMKTELDLLAVMREPISWLSSWWRYRQRPQLKGHPNSTFGISFDDFVRAYLRDERPSFANVGRQTRFLEPQPNGAFVKYLFRYEDQAGLQAFLKRRIKIDVMPEQRNVSPNKDTSLDKDVERMLRQAYADEFTLYESIGIGSERFDNA